MFNILSFDVEEWFDNFFTEADKSCKMERRADFAVSRIISALRDKDIRCTFFVLGRVAEENPEVVRLIDRQGHEVATHGYSHKLISSQTPKEFKDDLSLSIKIIKGITGKDVLGYRAPGYSIVKQTLWALDIIKECGLRYDSSIYPVSLRLFTHGGISGYPEGPFRINSGLMEFPLPTLDLLGLKFPVATTAYFRIFPYGLNTWAIDRLNEKGVMVTLNLHSWEFDEDHPRVRLSFFRKMKHYLNLDKTYSRFIRLINDYRFVSCSQGLLLTTR